MPSVTGDWRQISPSLNGESVLIFTPTTAMEFSVKRTGCGNVTGKATRNGNLVRLDWSGFLCSGYTEFTINPQCDGGSGEIGIPANFLACAGVHPITVKRVP